VARTRNNHVPKFRTAFVPLHLINVLPQPRRTFREIPELAESLAHLGFIQLPTVARFDSRERCEEYVRDFNLFWGTRRSVSSPKWECTSEDGREVHYVLIAGERRLRALKRLWSRGCVDCRKATRGRRLKPGECFSRHFGKGLEVRLIPNPPVELAMDMQFQENIHNAVPSPEEASAVGRRYLYMKKKKTLRTLAAFARKVGRSPSTVRRMLWYCQLPHPIQKAVIDGRMPYGIAVQLGRLRQFAKLNEGELVDWMRLVTVHNYKVPEFEERVDRFFEDRRSGQLSLENLMTEAAEKLEKLLSVRQPLERHTIWALHAYYHYFKRVYAACEEGLIGKEHSPMSSGSTVRLLRRHLELLEQLLPHLAGLLPRKVLASAPEMIRHADWLTAALEAELAKSDSS